MSPGERPQEEPAPPHPVSDFQPPEPWENVWRFLKELEIDLPYDPAIALLGIYPKDTDAGKRRDTCTPVFLAGQSRCSECRWVALEVAGGLGGR